jgi:hypothetical protein
VGLNVKIGDLIAMPVPNRCRIGELRALAVARVQLATHGLFELPGDLQPVGDHRSNIISRATRPESEIVYIDSPPKRIVDARDSTIPRADMYTECKDGKGAAREDT